MFGVVLGYAGMRLLAEYRIAFVANPRAVITLEVMLQVAKCGGPGYLAIVCLMGAAAFIFGGIGIFVAEALHLAGWL